MQTMRDKDTEEITGAAKAELGRAQARLLKDLETTPDDKINWSPSTTARTPIQMVAHAAMSVSGMQDWFNGTPFRWNSIEEADADWRRMEKEYTTRDSAVSLLNENCAKYCTWLDGLSTEKLNSPFETPFGTFPMSSAITFMADHLRNHAAQLEYLQTIYGDLDWHMG